jgi:carbonic anhydrase
MVAARAETRQQVRGHPRDSVTSVIEYAVEFLDVPLAVVL